MRLEPTDMTVKELSHTYLQVSQAIKDLHGQITTSSTYLIEIINEMLDRGVTPPIPKEN